MDTVTDDARADQQRAARENDRREGAVMLVVMLILMVATASAAVAVHTTQSELHAAGQDRMALQARYVSEAAIVTTTAWVDRAGFSGDLLKIWLRWQNAAPPDLTVFGEAPLLASDRHYAARTHEAEQIELLTANEVAPLSLPSANAGIGTPVDPAGLGSFGPRQAYVLPQDATSGQFIGYVVDLTDCIPAPTASTPGNQLNSTSGGLVPVQFYCVLTAHGRLALPGAPSTRKWTFGAAVYNQDEFASAHDSRATLLTPTMMMPNPNH